MRTVFLVPRRDDAGHRDALWKWCRRRWEALMPDVQVYEGHHTTGLFNRAAAINRAAALADRDGPWDVAVVIDSDVFLPIPNVRAAIASAAAGKVTWAHRRWRGLSEGDTARLIKDPDRFGPIPGEARDMDLVVEKTTPISWSCCVAIPRGTFDAMGGFDERFVGWGFEDGAWAALVRGIYPWDRVDGDMYHWWHPRSDERIVEGHSAVTSTNEYVRNALLGRRYMVAAIRDHAVGDQPGENPLAPAMVDVHVKNLIHDDRRFLLIAKQRHMPEAGWSDWWPTLEELAEGARAAGRSVTVVVHTGGTDASWPERSGYLRRSLASFADQVTGPIVQRVVYSDWGADHLDELAAIADEHGFYVAGSGHHGYTGSMGRMWAYLAGRAKGEYVFQAEDDFVYDRPVDLDPMIDTLRANPHLRQLALLRGPYYPRELAAGSVLATLKKPPELQNHRQFPFVEHRDHFTANPSLFNRSLTGIPWPTGESSSERVFGDRVLRDPDARFAYWGAGEPWITHVGAVRAGEGY